MKRAPKKIHPTNQTGSEQQNLRERITTKFTLLRATIVSITSLFGVVLCLSAPSFSMDPEILDDAYWSRLRTQKPVDEIYFSRGDESIPLTANEKNFLLDRCAREDFPLAQLEIAENLFAKKLKMTLVFATKFKMTLSTQLENEQHQDCLSMLLSKEAEATIFIANPLPQALTAEDWTIAKEFAKLGLRGLLNSTGDTDYTMVASQFGVGGFRPYQPFAEKLSLTIEEREGIFAYWNTQHKNSQILSKYIPEIGGTVPFSCLYVTTPFWIQCLEKNKEDANLFLLLNRFLIKLDKLPESDLTDLPWWRTGSGWVTSL